MRKVSNFVECVVYRPVVLLLYEKREDSKLRVRE